MVTPDIAGAQQGVQLQVRGHDKYNSVHRFFRIDKRYGSAFEINYSTLKVGNPSVKHSTVSCHGLLCVSRDDCSIYVYNPYTSETIYLPSLPFSTTKKANKPSHVQVGFGFDSSTHKYKVIAKYYDADDTPCSGPKIMTLGGTDQTWRDVKGDGLASLGIQYQSSSLDSVYVNGASHWMTYGRTGTHGFNFKHFIVSFDFENESFGFVPMPVGIHFRSLLTLYESEGRLCLMEEQRVKVENKNLILWVLTDYKRGIWMKQSITLPFDRQKLTGIVVIRTGEVLVFNLTEQAYYLCYYNQQGRVLKAVKITGIPENLNLESHEENLILNLTNL